MPLRKDLSSGPSAARFFRLGRTHEDGGSGSGVPWPGSVGPPPGSVVPPPGSVVPPPGWVGPLPLPQAAASSTTSIKPKESQLLGTQDFRIAFSSKPGHLVVRIAETLDSERVYVQASRRARS